jgi:hypothetical protein
LLGYKKEEITEPGTQKFFWKVAKKKIDDEFFKRL